MTPKTREELLDLIPAYTLGALDDAERGEVEAWLAHDPDAQARVASYQQVADHLVAYAPLRPAPEHLRADLQRRLAAAAAPATSRTARRPWWARARWGLAAALLALVALGVFAAWLLRSGEDAQPSAKKLYYQLEAQSGSRQYSASPGELDEAVSGELVISADGTQAVLCIWDLPAIAEDRVLQMWLIGQDGTRTSGGIFAAGAPEQNVYIRVPFDQALSQYQAVGVSLEPSGGSPYADQPSGPRVLSVRLS